MSIQVYPYNDQEEKELLDFLNSRHYNYKSADENELPDAEFLNQYNKELDEAEAHPPVQACRLNAKNLSVILCKKANKSRTFF